jgi:hypothetical protein
MGRKRGRTASNIFIFFYLFVFLISGSVPSFASEGADADTAFQKGVCYATWSRDRFGSEYSDKAIRLIKGMGVDCLQVNVTQYQQEFNSTEIFPTECTPSDRSVKHVIKEAHDNGLKVMLKPHIDLISKDNGYWRADIGFYDEKSWEDWFREYEKFILHYAKIAQRYDVEIFCVGTELCFTTQKQDEWRRIIEEVRRKYDGKLIYAANWDNYQNISFWDALDYVGIDAYFPLTYKENPSIEDIKKGWLKWLTEIEIWQENIKRPVIFTEIGYSSSALAAGYPWKNGRGNADVQMQAKCYTAFFQTVWKRPWLGGVYWWRMAPTIYGGGPNNRHFTPLKKPAAKIIKDNYRQDSTLRFARAEAPDGRAEGSSAGKMPEADLQMLKEYLKLPSASTVEPLGESMGLMHTSMVLPLLKTQHGDRFRKRWEEKQMLESLN